MSVRRFRWQLTSDIQVQGYETISSTIRQRNTRDESGACMANDGSRLVRHSGQVAASVLVELRDILSTLVDPSMIEN